MKKIAALTIGSAILLNSMSFAFSDLGEEHWAYRNVINMQEKGIVSGFEDNTFRPNEFLTREQFITMAVKGLNIETPFSPVQFEDSLNRWSEEFIKIAGNTMVNDDDTDFRPAEYALREDVAMAIVRLNNLEDAEYNLETLNNFSDKESISENRQKYVAIAVENGFMSGNTDGTFNPLTALNRAEGATVIFNMLNKIENDKEIISEENLVNWDGEYISNIDGLTKVKLTKISDTEVNFYIKGVKGSSFGANQIATITDDTAIYTDSLDEETKIKFKFENSNLIIETSGNEGYEVFAGIYKIDDGTTSTIERTIEKNTLENTYLLGEKIESPEVENFEELETFLETAPKSLTMEILNMTSETVDFTLGGFADGSMIVTMGSLTKSGESWVYFDESLGENTIEIKFLDNLVVVTGLTEDREKLSGEYIKQIETVEDEFKEYENQINEIEIYEGVIMY